MNTTFFLGLVLSLALLPSNVVAATLLILRAEWHASALAIAWVFAAYQVGYLIAVLFLLPLTDRVPAGRVMAGCAVASSTAFVLFPFLAHGVWSAAGLRLLAGLGLAGIYLPGVRVVAAATAPPRRGSAVGAYVSAFYLGTAASFWLSGALLPGLGWRGAALALGVVSAAALPLAILATRNTAPVSGTRAHLDLSVLRDGPVLRTILAYTGHSWELYVSRGWLAAFVTSVLAARGLSPTAAASAGSQWAALMAGLGTPGVWLGGWLSDSLGRSRAALGIALASGFCSLWFGLLGTAPWALLVAAGCVYGVLVSADSAIYSTAVTELAPRDRIGSAQAVQAFLGFGATAAAPLAAGWLIDLGVGWGGVFALAGVVGLGLALSLLPLARRSK